MEGEKSPIFALVGPTELWASFDVARDMMVLSHNTGFWLEIPSMVWVHVHDELQKDLLRLVIEAIIDHLECRSVGRHRLYVELVKEGRYVAEIHRV